MSATDRLGPSRRRRRFRLSTMETLGFYEESSTATSWTSTPNLATSSPAPAPQPRVDPFADWQPTEVGRRFVTGRIRWGQVLGVLMMCAGIAGIAAWLYQRPAELAAEAVDGVYANAEALRPSLTALQTANDLLLTSGGEAASVTAALLEVDNRARQLFQASASLPQGQDWLRTAAADVASEAIDTSRLLADSIAFKAGVTPILSLPSLQTDPQLVSLDEAARAFGEWQAKFDAVRTALPTGLFTQVTQGLSTISLDLATTQAAYLDALRADDAEAAQATLADLSIRLDTLGLDLEAGMVESHQRIEDRIAEVLSSIESLFG